MLIITAVSPEEMLSNLAFQIAQMMKNGGKTRCLGCQYIAGYSNIVEGSILVTMIAKCLGFATVTPEFVSIRFRLAVRRLRGLCWASIVCETLSF